MATTLDAQLAGIQKRLAAQNKTVNTNADCVEERDLVDNTVTRSNALARAYYRFTIPEKRIMEALISRLHPQRTDNDLQHIKLLATDYAKTYSTENAYRDLSTAAQGLMRKVITTTEGLNVIESSLMAQAVYTKTEGTITCTFNPLIVHHLIGMKAKFSSYPLNKVINFSSSYTWRLYELLVSWAQPKNNTGGVFCGWFDVDVDELRKMLGVPTSYNQGRFKKSVLEHVTNELLHKAEIRLQLTPKKTGRKITSYSIKFAENDQQQIPLNGGKKGK